MVHTSHKRILLTALILGSLYLQSVPVGFACTAEDNYTGCGSAEAHCEAGDLAFCNPPGGGLGMPNRDMPLLQPLDDSTYSLAPAPGIFIFFNYFNLMWPWVLGSAAGIGLLQALIGGIQIMISGSSSASEAGKTRIMWAMAGLLMVGLAGFILRSINPVFYD
jgi:hypothetical protein